jgi:two-component system sensor histidine kinase RegB
MPDSSPASSRAISIRQIDRLEVNASWLLRLRWVAVVGQVITILVAMFPLGVQLAVGQLLSIVAFTAATNIAFAWWLQVHTHLPEERRVRQDHWVLGSVMGIDLLSLTLLLYYSGGPGNPFIIFYFVNLALAAIVLPTRWSWWLLLVALVCLAFLFGNHVTVPELAEQVRITSNRELALQQVGLVTAVGLCAGVAIYFITRVTRELQQREEQLRLAEQERARGERLEALATLAAGAGHELASPLSTIAVIANDLTKHLAGTNVPDSVIEDVGLIRSELDHCRHILDGMASGAGQATGEEMRPLCAGELIDEVLDGLRRRSRVNVTIDDEARERMLVVPLISTANSIRGLIRNALDASASESTVDLSADVDGGRLCLTVRDHGIGMPPEILARVGEPFFTTKEPGEGMGLGLFLTQNLFQRLGGELLLESEPGVGTTAVAHLPFSLGNQ